MEMELLVGAGFAGAAFAPGWTLMTATASRCFLLFLARFLDESLAREANFVALDGEDFYEDLIAELELVANVANAMFGDFANV